MTVLAWLALLAPEARAIPPDLGPVLELAPSGDAPELVDTGAPAEAPPPVTAEPEREARTGRVVERLVEESASVRGLLTGGSGVLLVALVSVAVGGVGLVSRLARAARASGYDVERRLTGARIVLVVAVGVWAASAVVRYVLLRAPLVGTTLLVVFAGGALLGLAHTLQRAANGTLLLIGQQLREGDRITVGDTTGTVEHAGPLRLRLRRADGAIVWLPTSQLADAAVVVSSPRRTHVVAVMLERERPLTAEERERMRRLAVLCPYREPATEVSVEQADGGVRVELRAWSARAAQRAERWLRASVEAVP